MLDYTIRAASYPSATLLRMTYMKTVAELVAFNLVMNQCSLEK